MKNLIKSFKICSLVAIMFAGPGCKTKQKTIRDSQVRDKGMISNSDSSRLIRNNQSLKLMADSVQVVSVDRSSVANRHSIEFSFELDPNKKFTLADAANYSPGQLMADALSRAKSVKIKTDIEQVNLHEKTLQAQKKHVDLSLHSTIVDSSGVIKHLDKKDLLKKDHETIKQKDSPGKTIAGSFSWWYIFGGFVFCGLLIFIFRRFFRS